MKRSRRARSADRSEHSEARAKVFWSGRSQAVRLPKAFRVTASELRIHQEGRRIVLELPDAQVDDRGWPLDFWAVFGALPENFDVGGRQVGHERRDPLAD